MKPFFYLLFVSLLASTAIAQDIIIKKNGDEIQAKVVEIDELKIKYRKFEQQNGPIYNIAKTDVFMIRYKDGTKDVFTTETATSPATPTAVQPDAITYPIAGYWRSSSGYYFVVEQTETGYRYRDSRDFNWIMLSKKGDNEYQSQGYTLRAIHANQLALTNDAQTADMKIWERVYNLPEVNPGPLAVPATASAAPAGSTSFFSYYLDPTAYIGFMAGGLPQSGGISMYFSARINPEVFTVSIYDAGSTGVFDYTYNGEVFIGKGSLCLGLTYKLADSFYGYSGAGYGAYNIYYGIDKYYSSGTFYESDYARYVEASENGIEFETGILVDLNGFTLQTGTSSTNFYFWEWTFGLGISW